MDRKKKMRTVYRYHNKLDDNRYLCTESYKVVDNPQKWELCDICELIPKIWQYDNGRRTACGCGVDIYSHFSISAESVMSVIKRSENGTSVVEYDVNSLRDNWNNWVKYREDLFQNKTTRKDGRW